MPRQTARYSPQSSSSYHLGLSGYLIELLCCHLDMEDLRNIIYPGNDKIAPPILNVEVPRFPLSKGLMQKIQFSPVMPCVGNTPAPVMGEPGRSLPMPVALMTSEPGGNSDISWSFLRGSSFST